MQNNPPSLIKTECYTLFKKAAKIAVLIEAINIVVDSKVFNNKPDIEAEFLKNVPSQTYCSDGLLHRIGFMDYISTNNYVYYLQNSLGLTHLDVRILMKMKMQ